MKHKGRCSRANHKAEEKMSPEDWACWFADRLAASHDIHDFLKQQIAGEDPENADFFRPLQALRRHADGKMGLEYRKLATLALTVNTQTDRLSAQIESTVREYRYELRILKYESILGVFPPDTCPVMIMHNLIRIAKFNWPEALAIKDAVEHLVNTHYRRHPVLMKSIRERLESVLLDLQEVFAAFNSFLPDEAHSDLKAITSDKRLVDYMSELWKSESEYEARDARSPDQLARWIHLKEYLANL